MRESKAELTDRLRREGRWEDFEKRREQLKASGMGAWIEARDEDPPLDDLAPNLADRVDV